MLISLNCDSIMLRLNDCCRRMKPPRNRIADKLNGQFRFAVELDSNLTFANVALHRSLPKALSQLTFPHAFCVIIRYKEVFITVPRVLHCFLCLFFFTINSACPNLIAGIVITVPDGLKPGDSYRLAFVTSGKRNSLSLSIDDYNLFVTTQANQNHQLLTLNTTWTVLGSTPSVSARQNTITDPANGALPIYALDGSLVAQNYNELWRGRLRSGIVFDQNGDLNRTRVSTGTSDSGYQWFNGELGRSSVSFGDSGNTGSAWIRRGDGTGAAEESFYAVSGYLTVTAVPEPNSIILLGIATCNQFLRFVLRRNSFMRSIRTANSGLR